VLDDPRVSGRHACLRWTGGGWRLRDLGSKNGTTVNGFSPGNEDLRDQDWISFGGLMGRFERLSAAQAAELESERLARLQTSIGLRRRLSADLEPIDLLLHLLEAAMEVTRRPQLHPGAGPDGGCGRGGGRLPARTCTTSGSRRCRRGAPDFKRGTPWAPDVRAIPAGPPAERHARHQFDNMRAPRP
jgi:hypothetical protein